MDMLPNVLNLAAAGGIDLAYASDMITDSQSALGLSLEETSLLVDQMAMAASKSNTSVSQLGEAILTVGGTAKSLSGGTTELATALGILADNGIKGAEGGTALRNIILSLSSPTDKAAQLMQELGVQVFDAEGNMRSLNDVFGDLNTALSGMSEQDRMNVLSELFNKVDLKSANALLANTGDRFNELSGYIDSAAGSAEQMANTQLDNLAGDVTMLKSAFEGLQIEVSDKLTPALRWGVQGLTDLVSHAGEIAGAIGPAIGAFATFSTYLIVTQKVVPYLKSSFVDFFKLLAANPMAIAIGLMAGLAIAAYHLATHFGELYTEADKAAEGVRNLNRATESSVSDFAEADAAAGHAVENIKTKLQQLGVETAARMGAGGSEGAQAYKNNLISELEQIDPAFAAVVSSTMENNTALMASYGPAAGQAGSEAITEYANGIAGGSDQVNSAMSSAVDNAMASATASAEAGAAQATVAGTAFGQNLANGLKAASSGMVSAASSAVTRAIAAARGATGGASSVGANIGSGIAGGIMAAAGRIATAAANVVRMAISAAKAAASIASPSKKFRDEVGLQMGLGVAEGLEDSEDKVVQAAKQLAEKTYSTSAEWLRRETKFQKLTLEEQIEVWQDIQSQFIETSKQWIQAEEEIFDLREKLADERAKAEEKAAKDAYDDAREQIRRRTKFEKLSIVEQIEMWDDLLKKYEANSEEYLEIDEKIFDLREDLAEDYEKRVGDTWNRIADAYNEYSDAVASRSADIASAYGLFDDVQDRYRMNGDELVTNLTRQVNVMTSFYDQLDQLAERGAGAEMVEEIRQMGPKAADQLDALVKLSDKQFRKYVELYGKKQQLANSTAVKELAKLKDQTGSEIKAQLRELDRLYDSTAPTIGESFAQNLAQGIKDGLGSVVNAATKLAEEANNAFLRKLNLSTSIGSSLGGTKSTLMSQSALGAASTTVVNTLANGVSGVGGTFNVNMNVDGQTIARATFDPLKNYAASQGQPIVVAT